MTDFMWGLSLGLALGFGSAIALVFWLIVLGAFDYQS